MRRLAGKQDEQDRQHNEYDPDDFVFAHLFVEEKDGCDKREQQLDLSKRTHISRILQCESSKPAHGGCHAHQPDWQGVAPFNDDLPKLSAIKEYEPRG